MMGLNAPRLNASQVNGMLLEGKKVYVGPFVQRGERPGGAPSLTNNVLSSSKAALKLVKRVASSHRCITLRREKDLVTAAACAAMQRAADGTQSRHEGARVPAFARSVSIS